MSYQYGPLSCRRTMLLIMISLKELIPSITTDILQPYSSYIYRSDKSPKEKELLLRLYLSSLPTSTVLSELSSSHSSYGDVIIHNLHHLPIDILIDNYIMVPNGLLDIEDTDYLNSIIHLLVRISNQSSARQNTLIVEQMLGKLSRKENQHTVILLQGITSILQNTYYILDTEDISLLMQLYKQEMFR